MDKTCSVKGCESKSNLSRFKEGLIFCQKHRIQMSKFGEIKDKKPNKLCSYCGSNYQVYKSYIDGNDYCGKHNKQIKRFGKICEFIYKNEIIIKNDYALIVLRDNKQNKICETIVDLEDIDDLKKFKWHATYSGSSIYVVSNVVGGKNLRLHDYLIKPRNGFICDHINRNTLDNRRKNLREASYFINSINCKITKGSKSGCVGVNWNPEGKWVATITVNKNRIYLGRFGFLRDAVTARKEAELKYFGEVIKR